MRQAVARAPIWVIAIMAHVLLAAVLGGVHVRRKAATREADALTVTALAPEHGPLIDDAIVIDLPRDPLRLPAAPEDGEILRDLALLTAGNPFDAGSDAEPGRPGRDAPEGSAGNGAGDAPGGGGSVGLGPGGAGGGAPRGLFGNARLARLRQRADLSPRFPLIRGSLRWLREHQSDDGAWDCDGFALRCDPSRGAACGGAGNGAFDVGVTGLALLAFLGAGYDGGGRTLNDEAVRRGLKWLRDSQDAEGCFGPRQDPRFAYAHACATIAMCEAATFTRSPQWRRSAQAGIRFIEACHNPYAGWRYGVRPGESDASVTGWMLLALKAGRDAGLEVGARALRDGLAFVDAITDKETGRTGYTKPGDLPVRPDGFVDRWPARESESLTAVALCARIFLGREPGNGLTRAGATLIAAKPPVWDDVRGTIDMYYWYHGTLAMHQLGGPAWARWDEAIEKSVAAHQVRTGCAEGSWDPEDPWGADGGRVYATALMTLCLEVHWRYPLVFGTRESTPASPR